MKHLPLFTPEQARRHEVRPGITGWAQVNGRNALDWDQKCKLDVWYVDHISMLLDFKILAMTVSIVLSGKGIDRPDFSIPLRRKNSGNEAGQCDKCLGR
jgi:lipopolysaccharide/colanic/teichoic acid biosynthesis glycosyltransferase